MNLILIENNQFVIARRYDAAPNGRTAILPREATRRDRSRSAQIQSPYATMISNRTSTWNHDKPNRLPQSSLLCNDGFIGVRNDGVLNKNMHNEKLSGQTK